MQRLIDMSLQSALTLQTAARSLLPELQKNRLRYDNPECSKPYDTVKDLIGTEEVGVLVLLPLECLTLCLLVCQPGPAAHESAALLCGGMQMPAELAGCSLPAGTSPGMCSHC